MKKILLRITSFLLAAIMMVGFGDWSFIVLKTSALSMITSGDYKYSILDDGTVAIKHCFPAYAKETDQIWEIPSEIDGYTVSSIDLYSSGLDNYIKTVIIPSSITFIGTLSLIENRYNTEFIVAEDNPAFTSVDGVLFNKDCTEIIRFPPRKDTTSYEIPYGVENISGRAFYENPKLCSVIIPNTVTVIGDEAFYNAKQLSSIYIPQSVVEIGRYAFVNNSLSEINVDKNNFNYASIDGVLYNKDFSILMRCPSNTQRESFTIPSGVVKIDSCAFDGGKNLTQVYMPDSLTEIEYAAFQDCAKLKEIMFPDGLRCINAYAFDGCSQLSTVTMTNSIAEIKSSAFRNCKNIKTVYFYGTEEDWGKIKIASLNDALTTADITYIDVHVHDMTAVSEKAATCTSDGNYAYWYCNECGKYYSDADGKNEIAFEETVITMTDHIYTVIQNDGVNHWYKCENCDEFTSLETHNGGVATCANKAVCTVCGISYGELSDHIFSEWTQTIAPTCTATGIEIRCCENCDNFESRPVDMIAHDYSTERTEDTAPTCTAAGSKSHHCTRCDIKADVTEIPALGHSFGEWKEVEAAAFSEDGESRRYCSVCDAFETRRIPKLSESHTHDFSGREEIISAATCTAEGSKRIYCTEEECGEYIVAVIGMTAHLYSEQVSDEYLVSPATCSSKAVYCKSCSVCGIAGSETFEYGEFDMNNHVGGTYETVQKKATCEEDGVVAHCCSSCNNVLSTDVIEATGHDWIAAEVVEAAPGRQGYTLYVCQNDPGHTYKGDFTDYPSIYGDVNNDGYVDSDDAIYLFKHINDPEQYPIDLEAQNKADFNSDGITDSDDAVYLLYHTLLPERFPLRKQM